MLIRELTPGDWLAVQDMLIACGAFTAAEVAVALELLDEKGYVRFAAEVEGNVCGYVCIGQTPLTMATWHLYWICVHPRAQRKGVARTLQMRVESFIRKNGGDRLVLETSGQPAYERARHFYQGGGYQEVGRIRNYYKPNDDCVIYCKEL